MTDACPSPAEWERNPCFACGLPTGYRTSDGVACCVPCHDAMCEHFYPGSPERLRDFSPQKRMIWRQIVKMSDDGRGGYFVP